MVKPSGGCLLASVILASVLVSCPVCAMDTVVMQRTIDAYVDLRPNDDIADNYRASHVRADDLDGDGMEEILYLLSADCRGANFDCPNDFDGAVQDQGG